MELVDRNTESGISIDGSAPGPASPALASADTRVRTYEELDGAEGHAVYFRPQRFSALDLAPLKCTVTVTHQGVARECGLRSVSQSGVGFTWPVDVPLQPGLSPATTCCSPVSTTSRATADSSACK